MRPVVNELRKFSDEKWLLAGKGPSFDFRHERDFSSYKTFGLEETILGMDLDYCHISDVEVAATCRQRLLDTQVKLVMPWYPMQHRGLGHYDLGQRVQQIRWLKELHKQRRLLSYNVGGQDRPEHPILPTVPWNAAFCVMVLNLMADAGIRRVDSFGMDGGSETASLFRPAWPEARSWNHGHRLQFTFMNEVSRRYKIYRSKLEGAAPTEPVVVGGCLRRRSKPIPTPT